MEVAIAYPSTKVSLSYAKKTRQKLNFRKWKIYLIWPTWSIHAHMATWPKCIFMIIQVQRRSPLEEVRSLICLYTIASQCSRISRVALTNLLESGLSYSRHGNYFWFNVTCKWRFLPNFTWLNDLTVNQLNRQIKCSLFFLSSLLLVFTTKTLLINHHPNTIRCRPHIRRQWPTPHYHPES